MRIYLKHVLFHHIYCIEKGLEKNDLNKSVLLILLILRVFLFESGTDLPEDEEMRKMLQTQLGKTEISLTLSNKFEVPEDDQADVQQLLVRFVECHA